MFSQQQDDMEAAAVCFRLSLLVSTLLGARGQNRDAAFRIVPNRLQVFQLESVFFHCEGLDGSTRLRGIRDSDEFISACDEKMSVLFCTIHRAYPSDDGKYWCETEGGQRSDSVSISVAAGSVVLDSPVLPVKEGSPVTLSCRNKTMSSNLTADFYKDGVLIGSSSTGQMTVLRVSKSDEGLYKCRIPDDGGESAESWLAVKALHTETCPSSDRSLYVLLLLRTVFTVLMVALLLLLVGLLHCGKLRAPQK